MSINIYIYHTYGDLNTNKNELISQPIKNKKTVVGNCFWNHWKMLSKCQGKKLIGQARIDSPMIFNVFLLRIRSFNWNEQIIPLRIRSYGQNAVGIVHILISNQVIVKLASKIELQKVFGWGADLKAWATPELFSP